MPKEKIIKPTEDQYNFYRQIFDEETFNSVIATIESFLKEDTSYFPLIQNLRNKFGYDNVEDIEHYHNNQYFDPHYKNTEKDSCDFLTIGVWADFNNRSCWDNILVASLVKFVWNDVHQYGWINDVTIYFSKSSAYFMKPLCTIDLSGKKILNWKWKGTLPPTMDKPPKNKYDDSSHMTNIEDLKQFLYFLIYEERIPYKIHAFERFGNLLHPKTGLSLLPKDKAFNYTRLLDEGYTIYCKLHRKTSYDSYIMELQRKLRKTK